MSFEHSVTKYLRQKSSDAPDPYGEKSKLIDRLNEKSRVQLLAALYYLQFMASKVVQKKVANPDDDWRNISSDDLAGIGDAWLSCRSCHQAVFEAISSVRMRDPVAQFNAMSGATSIQLGDGDVQAHNDSVATIERRMRSTSDEVKGLIKKRLPKPERYGLLFEGIPLVVHNPKSGVVKGERGDHRFIELQEVIDQM